MIFENFLDRRGQRNPLRCSEPPLPQCVYGLMVRSQFHTADREDIVRQKVEGPLGCHAGVELPKEARGRVAWIHIRLRALRDHSLVELLEGREMHDHLSPNGQELRCWPLDFTKAQGKTRNGSQVVRDDLPHAAVSARHAPYKQSVLVNELDGCTVQLRLEYVARFVFEPPAHAFVETAHLGGILGRIQGQHRHDVLRVGKRTVRLHPHSLGRRIRSDQVGMRSLQSPKLAENPIVLRVVDLRP